MLIILRHIRWIMVLAGALTMTMVYAAVAPDAALRSTFGDTLDGPLADIVVRNWGALIAMIGALLIYGAFRPEARAIALVIAAASKAVFIGLVMSHGSRFLGQQAGLAVAVDGVMIVLFAWYLVAARVTRAAAAERKDVIQV